MKKFTFLAFTTFLFFSSTIKAQEKTFNNTDIPAHRTCATDEVMNNLLSQDPSARQRYDAMQKMFNEKLAQIINNRQNRTNAIISVPVVVHIGLPDPNLVTDATVFNQLDTLNWTYGAASLTDSLRTYTPFRTSYGRSDIRFCLAQRTPTNLPSNGIERVVNNTVFTSGVHPSTQISAWDPTKYLNIWVVQLSGGVLGYSFTPGAFTASDPRNGFVNDYRAFGSGPSVSGGGYLFNGYNGGKTAVHEIGHFFNLFHPWSDATNASDNPTCTLSDGCADTPPTDGPTFNCPSAPVLNTCSPTAPGVMWQNHMDYADDACMTLFTKNQASRINSAIVTFPDRIGLTTSNACVPISLVPNNAGISAVSTPPANFITCDPTIPLTVTLKNFGSNTLTSVTITVTRNGTSIQTLPLTGLNITSLSTQTVPLNDVSLVTGINTIQICTSLPNGVADSDPNNDCFAVTVTRGAATALPLVEGFEGATFPPASWIVNNPDNGVTWQRTTTGVAHSGSAKAFVDHVNYNSVGQTDDLRTPPYAIGTADSLWVDFWGAYRGYPGFPFDQFQVMVSSDCGQTFQVVYNARNDTAFVAPQGSIPTTPAGYFPSAANQWIKKSLNLSNFIPTGTVQVQFRAINQFGNNMHLDDINIDKKIFQNNDAGVILINKPDARVCTSSQAPVVVIKNFGKINLTSVKINYQIDGGAITTFNWTGNLARNQMASVTLAAATLGGIGNHSINVYTTLPNNVTDQDPGNDGLVKAYSVKPILPLSNSVTEEFTSTTFPPTNWSIFNPDADMTWARTGTVGKKNPGSAFFDDWNNPTFDRIDDLLMPNYSYSGIDSIFVTFNVATVSYTLPGTTGARLDTLTVLLSKDCGNTFTTVYKKWGEDLQTVNDPNFPQSLNQRFIPKTNEWRLDSVNLGKWLGSNESMFQIAYRFSGNFENNLYLDDINLRTEVLPAKLKNQGYLVLPNPFRSSFAVWHYQTPANLRYINVYNSTGQLVYSKQFPGGGDKYIEIDLRGRAAGTYTVNVGYEDSNRNINVQVVKY